MTFFSPQVGLWGLSAIIAINLLAYRGGFNREEIRTGLFGFNAVFLGMTLGHDYDFNLSFLVLFISAILTLLLITVWLKGILTVNNLPFLSIPFIVSYWIVSLSASNFSSVVINDDHVYLYNEIARNQVYTFYNAIHAFDNASIPAIFSTFFKTLAGIFFQTGILPGIIIAFGLLYFSRIAFSLSLIGFSCVYLFYTLFGADVTDLNNNLIGANFIFLSIAIGCFFFIPNKYSYLAVVALTPVLILFSLAIDKFTGLFQLRAFSMSFSLTSIAFLFTMHQRWLHKNLITTTVQYFLPEKTIYKFLNSLERFKHEHLYKIHLPIIGEWTVSQGYDGKITHLGNWSKALDFVITDSKSATYREPVYSGEGFGREHFYCYNKDIIAPFDGYVYDIVNNVEENDIGEVNTEQNWGNTIILNHLNGLFSQISHVKKDSFQVFIGQYVTRGTYLAACGNSGRSPEPHIHFQLQTLPLVGAPTLEYPIAYFIQRIGNQKILKIAEVPEEGALISNVTVHELPFVAFSFYPGQKYTLKNEKNATTLDWEVKTDAFNRTYIYCNTSHSSAWFINDKTMFYFTDFEGEKDSILFHFYLAAYRQLLGFYEGIVIKDKIPINHFNNLAIRFFQDFSAPFYLFTKADFNSTFTFSDNPYAPQHIIIKSNVKATLFHKTFKELHFEMELKDFKINRFTIHSKNKSEDYFFH